MLILIDSSKTLLRQTLFEDTGGMYPELITRPDIKIFLPPIGNFTVYIRAIFSSLSFCSTFVFLSTPYYHFFLTWRVAIS